MRAFSPPLARLLLLGCASPFLIGSIGLRTDFDDRLLAAHNRERAAVSVPALAWDPKLAEGASAWADHLSRHGKFEHSPDVPGKESEGENIWGGPRRLVAPEAMVGLWIEEKGHYKPGIFPANSRSGRVEDVTHYTQVIWRRTTHVGCATGTAGEQEVLVCRYRTAGNVFGQVVS